MEVGADPVAPSVNLEKENARLRADNERLKREVETLKKRLKGSLFDALHAEAHEEQLSTLKQKDRADSILFRPVLQQTKALGIPADTALGMTSTPTGAQMSVLRSGMETPQTGEGMRTVPIRDPRSGNVIGRERISTMNIGSFARTQNPYTGPAAPAMGPASRVERGDYQYTDPQLSVNVEPRSPNQQRTRNQFALAANLTPGGRVKMGALNLGAGLGNIEAGIGSLTDSEAISRYGLTGRQLQQFGNRLMSQAAYRRGLQQGPTSISAPY